MCLETSNSLWLTSLADSVNGLTNSDLDGHMLQVLINSKHHSWVHSQGKIIEHVMVFIAQNVFGVKASVHKSDQTTHGDG